MYEVIQIYILDFEIYYIHSATKSLPFPSFYWNLGEIIGLKFFSVLVKTKYYNTYHLSC